LAENVITATPAPHEMEKLKHAPEELGLHPIIAARWSPRSFSERQISAQDLTKTLSAATWAASSYNEQPWRFIVGRRGDATFQKILDCLVEFNQAWAKSAAALVLSIGKKTFSHNGAANKFALYDTGAATANLMLEAIALGIHSHGMAGFDADKARAVFKIPDDFEVGAVIALGYLGDVSSLPEKLQKQETAPRSRKPLQEVVFSDWEQPAKF
jgi:nitroreductase